MRWTPAIVVVLLLFLGVWISGVFSSNSIICIKESECTSPDFKVIHGSNKLMKLSAKTDKEKFNCEEIWTVDYKAEGSHEGNIGDYEYIYFLSVNVIGERGESPGDNFKNPLVKVIRPMKVNFIYIILYAIVLVVFSVAAIPLFRKDRWDDKEEEEPTNTADHIS